MWNLLISHLLESKFPQNCLSKWFHMWHMWCQQMTHFVFVYSVNKIGRFLLASVNDDMSHRVIPHFSFPLAPPGKKVNKSENYLKDTSESQSWMETSTSLRQGRAVVHYLSTRGQYVHRNHFGLWRLLLSWSGAAETVEVDSVFTLHLVLIAD